MKLRTKFLLVGHKFMSEMLLKLPGFTIVLVVHSSKAKLELNSLYRLEIQILFTEMSLIRLVLNMIWLMPNQKT